MKSAIFQEQKRPTEPRAARKLNSKKRPRSHSPFKASPAAANVLNWNLDEMLQSYTTSGALPTPLSPTLPPRFAPIKPENGNLDHEDDGDDSVDSDIDNLPMSLLLPTLPHTFADGNASKKPSKSPAVENGKAPLAHPLPKKPPTTVSSVLTGGNSRNGKVRWVNRAGSSEKPRFLLRLTFKLLLAKYKSVFSQKPSTKVLGLGIEAKKGDDPDDKAYWLAIARETQEFSEKVLKSEPLLSVIAQFDWLLVLCIATDHEEKLRSVNKLAPPERQWHSLYKEIPHFVNRIERYIKANDVTDKQKSYLSFLVGILSVMKSLLLKRVNAAYQTVNESLQSKEPSTEIRNKIIDLQNQVIANYQQMEDHYAESQSFFGNCPAPSTIFPKSWSNRSGSIPKVSSEPLNPATDKYFLPLGQYSDVREGCAYLYACLKGFTDVFGPEINGGVKYNFQAGSQKNQS